MEANWVPQWETLMGDLKWGTQTEVLQLWPVVLANRVLKMLPLFCSRILLHNRQLIWVERQSQRHANSFQSPTGAVLWNTAIPRAASPPSVCGGRSGFPIDWVSSVMPGVIPGDPTYSLILPAPPVILWALNPFPLKIPMVLCFLKPRNIVQRSCLKGDFRSFTFKAALWLLLKSTALNSSFSPMSIACHLCPWPSKSHSAFKSFSLSIRLGKWYLLCICEHQWREGASSSEIWLLEVFSSQSNIFLMKPNLCLSQSLN